QRPDQFLGELRSIERTTGCRPFRRARRGGQLRTKAGRPSESLRMSLYPRAVAITCGAVTAVLVLALAVLALPQSPHRARRTFALRADSPAFWELVPRDAKLETLATGFGFTEGPVWDQSGFVYISDEEANKIYRVYRDGHKEELLALGDPDGNT